ncbi:hypothetical protein BDW59DRAFT_141808 [Aspergillus cavernicola]|uniref:hydroxyisourate hydrolase n=1 Tax=Aspergillus cavernicola TaxID=176166 RepID=A0ABR4IPL5_9EURO
MEPESTNSTLSSDQLGKITDRLSLHKNHLLPTSPQTPSTEPSPSPSPPMSRDPITCHVLNTLTGTPAANLPVTLTLLSTPAATQPISFTATTNADGRVASWTPTMTTTTTESTSTPSVPTILANLPDPSTKTNWSLRFEVGPWFEAQGVESFWPEVDVKFTVRGRGKEGEEGWRHYHVPVLLGPWNYSTYRGS